MAVDIISPPTIPKAGENRIFDKSWLIICVTSIARDKWADEFPVGRSREVKLEKADDLFTGQTKS